MTLTATRPDYAAARKAMIDSQLRTSGVNETFVLERMNAVAREDFVPEQARGTAYIDRAIPLGDGRYLAAPLFHGAMLEEARPHGDDTVLVVDGGSGYVAALIEPLVKSVTVITPAEAIAATAAGPFSLALIDGAVEHIPAALAGLVDNGGRVVTGLADRGVTRLAIGRKAGDTLALLPLAEMGVPVLAEFNKPKSWSF